MGAGGNIVGGIVRWSVATVLTAFFLAIGFSPSEWLAELWTVPPAWLSHPVVRIAAIILAGAVIALALRWEWIFGGPVYRQHVARVNKAVNELDAASIAWLRENYSGGRPPTAIGDELFKHHLVDRDFTSHTEVKHELRSIIVAALRRRDSTWRTVRKSVTTANWIIIFTAAALICSAVALWLAFSHQQQSSKKRQTAAVGAALVKPTEAEPFYTRQDVERVLEALFEVSKLLQEKGIPARDAAELFIKQWDSELLNKGEPAFRGRLKAVRLQVEAVASEAWAISNRYQHYNDVLAPVIAGVRFQGRFDTASRDFASAGEKLPGVIDQRTLTFLLPMRNEYQEALEAYKQWMSDVDIERVKVTQRFRTIAQKP